MPSSFAELTGCAVNGLILQKPVDFEGTSNFLRRVLPLGKGAPTQDSFGHTCNGREVFGCVNSSA